MPKIPKTGHVRSLGDVRVVKSTSSWGHNPLIATLPLVVHRGLPLFASQPWICLEDVHFFQDQFMDYTVITIYYKIKNMRHVANIVEADRYIDRIWG
jgi:hypothetical protein